MTTLPLHSKVYYSAHEAHPERQIADSVRFLYSKIDFLPEVPSYSLSLPVTIARDKFLFSLLSNPQPFSRLSDKGIRRLLQTLAVPARTIARLLQYRRAKAIIKSYEELLGEGFTANEMEVLKLFLLPDKNPQGIRPVIVDEDDEEAAERLLDIGIHPLPLNTATRRDLLTTGFFNEGEIERIIAYRMKSPIKSVLELTNVGIPPERIIALAPYLRLNAPSGLGLGASFDIRTQTRITNDRFPRTNFYQDEAKIRFEAKGKDFALYYALSSSNLYVLSDYADNWDRSVWNLTLTPYDGILILGHFQAIFGQNLLFGRQSEPSVNNIFSRPVKKASTGLRPDYSLLYDYDGDKRRDFFQGLAVGYRFDTLCTGDFYPKPEVNAFVSYYGYDSLRKFTNQFDAALNVETRLPFADTRAGFTVSRQVRDDGKFDGTGYSLYADSYLTKRLNLFTELAYFNDVAAVAGLAKRGKKYGYIVSAYYSGSNYLAPNASDILYDFHDTFGVFTGFQVNYLWIKTRVYTDFSSDVSKPSLTTRAEWKAVTAIPVKRGFLKEIGVAVKTRWINYPSRAELRNYFTLTAPFFKEKLTLQWRYQNMQYMPTNQPAQAGNILIAKLKWVPVSRFILSLRGMVYNTPSSSVDFSVYEDRVSSEESDSITYYGKGGEVSLSLFYRVNRMAGFSIRGILEKTAISSDLSQYDFKLNAYGRLLF